MKKISTIILALTLLQLPQIAVADCAYLLEATPIVAKYATQISSVFQENHTVADKLKIIILQLHGENGIHSGKFKPDIFFKLHTLFNAKNISDIVEIREMARENQLTDFDNIGDGKLESYRLLHNKYMQGHPAGIFFAPTASDIIEHKMALGCSHHARAFMAVAKALNLFAPNEIRYIVSSSYKDYNAACPHGKASTYNEKDTINGHQFVLLRLNGKWQFLNTSNKRFELTPAGHFDSYKFSNFAVTFPSYKQRDDSGHNHLLIRRIGENHNDGVCDTSFLNLMRISASSRINSSECRWAAYLPDSK
ncbi:hypothetical protein ACFL6Y_05570 [Elusimicrobiota bacterium]